MLGSEIQLYNHVQDERNQWYHQRSYERSKMLPGSCRASFQCFRTFLPYHMNTWNGQVWQGHEPKFSKSTERKGNPSGKIQSDVTQPLSGTCDLKSTGFHSLWERLKEQGAQRKTLRGLRC